MGHLWSLPAAISQSFPPKPRFAVEDIPDLSGKIIIVTGANTGIGKETVKALLSRSARVYIAARNLEKAERAIRDLYDLTGHRASFLLLDLADLKSVKAAAEEYLSKETELHVLFNNAGVMAPAVDQLTADGYDLQFGTNVLGHFYLTKLLLPVLIATAKSSPEGISRVVTSSSLGHTLISGLDFSKFKDSPARRRASSQSCLYPQSKYGNIVFAVELARRYGDQGIVSTSLNPGNINTELFRHIPNIRLFIIWFTYSAAYGALTQLWAGTSAEGAMLNGKYLIPWAREGVPHPGTQDPELGKALWTWLEEQVEHI